MFDAKNIKQSFSVTTPGFAGSYEYGNKFTDNWRHTAWVWMPASDKTAPHLTLFEGNFTEAGKVERCHLTYTYNHLPGRELHVYFNVHPVNGTVKFSNIDPNRCGSDGPAAKKQAEDMKVGLTLLAADLLMGAFPP